MIEDSLFSSEVMLCSVKMSSIIHFLLSIRLNRKIFLTVNSIKKCELGDI